MKIGSGTITGRIASPDTGRVKEYELTLKDISTEAETAGGEVKGRISSPDTGRVGDYTFTLDEVIAEGDLTNGTVKGRIASPDTGNVGTYKLQLKDFQIEGGGGKTVEEKDVNFIDYDGTLVDSYTKDEFLALNALPANPTHEGLVSQGWNWSLEDAKAYLEKYDTNVTIGQMYITDDGVTRLYCEFDDLTKNPCICISVNGTVEVDWGDGSEKIQISGTSLETNIYNKHSYDNPGSYVISIKVIDGSFLIKGVSAGSLLLKEVTTASITNEDKIYLFILKKIEIGKNVSIDNNAFGYCRCLETITIPEGTIIGYGNYIFRECSRLKSVTFPKGVTRIGTSAFSNCYSISNVAIPEGVTSIGDSAFQGCSILKNVTIPEGVVSIGKNAFNINYYLKTILIPEGVTSIGDNAFSGCFSLENVKIHEGVTSISNYTFQNACSIKKIELPESVTSINSYAFNNCNDLRDVTIPKNVTNIGITAFGNCYGLSKIRVLPVTPPQLSSNSFPALRTNCVIYVPADSINAYKNATNWSKYASQIVGE